MHFRQRNPVPTMPKTIGDFIRMKRVEAGLSQKEIAPRMVVSLAAIFKWEANETAPVGRFYRFAIADLGFERERRA